MVHRFIYLFMVVALFVPQNSNAQSLKDRIRKNKKIKNTEYLNVDAGYEKIILPELFSNSVLIDDDEDLPKDPNINKVQFLKIQPVNGIAERIDRLIQGVKKDIPPKYDHYGYEIRRYMAHVGNIKIFQDETFLKEQVRNVGKAQIIAEYWKKHVYNEIKEIEKLLEESESVSFASRTAFKQNKVTIRIFMVSLIGWIDANERVLMTLFNFKKDGFDMVYPEIIISDAKYRLDFYNNMNAKQTKLKELVVYNSFSMMVY